MAVVRVGAVALVLCLLGLLVWDVAHRTHGGIAAKVDAGQTVAAPKLQLPRLGGGSFDLAALRGKVVVLNFWASWCVECKAEAKTLHDAAARWHGKDVVVIGVDTKDLSFAAERYMARYDVNYPVIRDVDGSKGNAWGVTGYPETFIVDRSGRVVPPHVDGPIPAARLDDAIRQALRA
ncbi:MAG: TlpA family protein disulfide reductase [Actinobacteria bacterium]|nr:TlpA family protein disulfide reductase [Actinomycetota bacterium]